MELEEALEQADVYAEETEVCTIDAATRTISVPAQLRLFGVENDKRVERIYFHCPKIVGDNQDLSKDYQLFMNYQNANGDPDAYHIQDMEVDGDNITFSWLLEENVTKYRGNIQFAFGAIIPGDEAEDPDKNRWNTTINTDCTCLVGLECTQQVAESDPDALAQIWSAIDELKAGDSYTLPIMSDTQLGGGKAVSKTDEDVPVAVDPSTGQLFVPTYPEKTGGDVVNVDAELKEYMNVAKPAIASAIINKGGSVEPDDSLNDYATRISTIPNDVYPAETLPVQTNLSASGLQDSIGIKLNWSDVNASGYIILRKENAMPATSADGDIVYNGTYAADGYTDTGVQKGKVYYYRIFPRNSKNQYQSLEDGAVAMVDYKDRTRQTLLGDLPLGSKIKFGQWNGSDFFWEVVDTQDKASGFVTVAADQNLGNRQYDAPEPNSPIASRKTQGNNRWAYSAVRQLLNSEADADAWWTAQCEYDAEPSYAAQIPGFLKDFTTYEKGIIVTKTNKCILPNDDGGGSETVLDKFWLPSYYAMGLGVIQPLEDNHIYEKFVDNESRSYQSNYWLRSINGAESPSIVRVVSPSGGAANGSIAANGSSIAVRPFCQLPTSAYMTWSDSDEAYVFADDSQRNPSA